MSGTVGGGQHRGARSELHTSAEASIEPDSRWAQYMPSAIPECSEVRDDILAQSGRDIGVVDEEWLLTVVRTVLQEKLRETTIGRVDVTWDEIRSLLARPDYDPRLLSKFLSTKGAVGVAINDKISALLSVHIPAALLLRVRAGDFDIR
ncbi:hypothetical protein [Antrihabitans stalactiti]|uniref:Uncharacterized protein n=1 Tax=Antrihabitans stalactiti TaxID=2584121 RepID=A0A848K9Q8_9NOCA|nr:hypothetical protein [Antrihabitans stalactiti]NMN95079.1 hypothetical protein [Antrihabitans stalactiti]